MTCIVMQRMRKRACAAAHDSSPDGNAGARDWLSGLVHCVGVAL